MIIRLRWLRRSACLAARTGAAASGMMLAISIWAAYPGSLLPAGAAATDAGSAKVIQPRTVQGNPSVPLASGGSSTPFTLELPAGAACTGDSANDGYRWQTYMVPASVDPGTLQFGANGPNPFGIGAAFRQPLFETTGSPVVQQQTQNAATPPGPGPIINIPDMNYAVFSPGDIPAGTYNVGIACTLGPAGATQLDRFWGVQMVVATSSTDSPAKIAWTVSAQQAAATTTTAPGSATTTTAPAATTTTAAPASTTTTVSGATTTTTALDGTTTTTSPDGAGAPSSSGGPTSGDPGSSTGGGTATGSLPRTGGSVVRSVVWAILLVILGRSAVLLGRSLKER